jgi:hypothetical protein
MTEFEKFKEAESLIPYLPGRMGQVIWKGISCTIAKPKCLRNGMTSKLVEACQSSRPQMGRQSKPTTNDGTSG